MKNFIFFLSVFLGILCLTKSLPCSHYNVSSLSFAKVPEGFCPFTFYRGLSQPRTITTMINGDILVLEAGLEQVSVLYTQSDGTIVKAKLATAIGLNHGLAVNNGYLYASNATNLFRWHYEVGQRSHLGPYQIVVDEIPCCHHVTRTIVFDSHSNLFLQSGSGANVDPDPSHGQIRKFNFLQLRNLPLHWSEGQLWASGIRNEVGLAFDSKGRLFGVENGRDDLFRQDLGGDIHADNPCEKVNLFTTPGGFYGYPYCWSQWSLPSQNTSVGTLWADPEFMPNYTDAWCRNTSNVIPPVMCLPAHSAPLAIKFVQNNSFPEIYQGAYVALHGSWDRPHPIGYSILLLSLNSDGIPVNFTSILSFNNPNAASDGLLWPHRFAGITTHKCSFGDCLLVSSDTDGEIIGLGWAGI